MTSGSALLVSVMGVSATLPDRDPRIPEGAPMSAGYVPAVERLGVPALRMSDASLGVTNPGFREGDTATALPAGLALGATFNPALARAAGRMLGREARARGFNVMLAGGINLARDPRNGRNFEYLAEDPCLSAVLAAESIAGIQDEGVISTIKHFTLNCNETNRHWLDATIDPDADRESDLLAFELAIERARPGAGMTAYNKVNGTYAGGNAALLQDLLKDAWEYPGWVMSDWGATPAWEFALAGLDQESGAQIRSDDVGGRAVRGTLAGRARGRQAAAGAAGRDGAADPALQVRGRRRRVGGRRTSTWARTTRSRSRPRGRASSCSRTTACCRSRPTRRHASR